MASHSEISLRHLPDQSDSSLSFQIPQAVNAADLLLTEAEDDFLNDNELSFATPVPPKRFIDEPLTLSQLTPTPRGTPNRVGLPCHSMQSPPTIRASPLKTPHTATRQILGRREIEKNTPQPVDSPISKERLANLKAEVDSLEFAKSESTVTGSSPAEPTTSAGAVENSTIERFERPIRKGKGKATVADGGVIKIAKNKPTQPSSSIRGVPPASRRTDLTRPTTAKMIRPKIKRDKKTKETSTSATVETSDNVDGITAGAAERLLMYGNNLMMTHGHLGSGNVEDHENTRTDNPASVALTDIASPAENSSARHEDPFTLSQISPRKQQGDHPILLSTAATTQDPAPPALESLKTGKVNIRGLAHRSARPVGPAQPSTRKHITASSSKIRSSPKRERKLGLHTRQAISNRNESRERSAPVNVPSSSRRGPTVAAGQASGTVIRTRSSSSGPHSIRHKAGKIEVPPVPKRLTNINPTKPVEFTFRSGARLEARKNGPNTNLSTSESEQRATASFHDSIPDFRALHEQQMKASIAFRKEHIAPTIPVTPDLNTKYRAKEREKFDELMRSKEEEMEHVREEKRKQQEVEDEKEMREIRKRAIPKAHDVPDWYASAPKRGTGSQS